MGRLLHSSRQEFAGGGGPKRSRVGPRGPETRASELEPGVADFSVQNAECLFTLSSAWKVELKVLLEDELVSEHTRRTR